MTKSSGENMNTIQNGKIKTGKEKRLQQNEQKNFKNLFEEREREARCRNENVVSEKQKNIEKDENERKQKKNHAKNKNWKSTGHDEVKTEVIKYL